MWMTAVLDRGVHIIVVDIRSSHELSDGYRWMDAAFIMSDSGG